MAQQNEPQKRTFEFLRRKFEEEESFSKDEFFKATGYSAKSFGTYFSKQFSELLKPIGGDQYRVSGIFRRFRTWKELYENVLSQKRRLVRHYDPTYLENVVIFEFYMPLRNELWLRESLDAMFYRDSVRSRLASVPEIEVEKIEAGLPANATTTDKFEKICDFVSEKFGGYSIALVSGRFRAGPLRNRAEVHAGRVHEPYLIDETTAVVKFIAPCVSTEPDLIPKEAQAVRILFDHLFVQSILELVNAEDEVWVLESGIRHRLQIHRAKN